MQFLNYNKSKELKKGEKLLVSHRLHAVENSKDSKISLWKNDEVTFIETISLDNEKEEHIFLASLSNDTRDRYGTFKLLNFQVQ